MSLLHTLSKLAKRRNKRLGRGIGSGKGGHTSSRGTKGQISRNGTKVPLWFEGGQLPIVKRMPMWRGKGKFKVVRPTAEVSLLDLENMKATTITLDTLKLERVIDSRFKKAKIIGTGALSRSITVEGVAVSASAKKAIETVGGSVK